MPAPKPPITRIDFTVTTVVVAVNKFEEGWDSHPRAAAAHLVEGKQHKPGEFDLEAALKWCADHGWTVRRWPGGARAFKDGLKPVRTAEQIQRMRRELSRYPRPELQGQGVRLDLAYDL